MLRPPTQPKNTEQNIMQIPTNHSVPVQNNVTQAIWDSVENAFGDLILKKGLVKEPTELEIIPSSGTAHWFWMVQSHQIRVCVDILDQLAPRAGAKNMPLLIKRVVWHEIGHALWSARDKKGATDLHAARDHIINKLQLSFQLWNIGEDCWMENMWRVEQSYRFGWLNWLDTTLPMDYSTVATGQARDDEPAHGILLDIKLCDNKRADLMKYTGQKSLGGSGWKRVGKPKRERVYNFYKEVCRAADSWEVADLMDEFRRVFPESDFPVEPINSPQGPGGSPNQEWQDISDMRNKGQAGARQHGSVKIDQLGRTYPHNFRSVAVNNWTKGCGDKALTALRKGLRRGQAPTQATTNPSSNINIQDFLAGKPDCYRKTVAAQQGKEQRVEVVFDLSSSMQGDYFEDGIKLMDALKTLHDSKEIVLRITWVSSMCLVQWHGDDFLPKHLGHIAATGGSPLGQGLNEIEPDIDKDTLVIGYTDGAIDFDTYEKKKFLAKGVRPIGAFITDDIDRLNGHNMKDCFEVFDVSGDLGSLAMGLGKNLKRIADMQA